MLAQTPYDVIALTLQYLSIDDLINLAASSPAFNVAIFKGCERRVKIIHKTLAFYIACYKRHWKPPSKRELDIVRNDESVFWPTFVNEVLDLNTRSCSQGKALRYERARLQELQLRITKVHIQRLA